MEETSQAQEDNEPEPMPIADLLLQHPRIPITASMLYTYAHLRGQANQMLDPLHHALFPSSNRELFPQRMWIPRILKCKSMEELHKGAKFFWDPIAPTFQQPPPPLPRRRLGLDHPNQTFEEWKRLNPPSVGANHYKGDMVNANFGYFLVEDRWVDPESEGALFDAYMGRSEESESITNLPNLHRSRESGPRIMQGQELEDFYNQYVEDVTDSVDGEGDPRALRITPATFARWAYGAVAGDHYEEELMAPQEKLQNVAPNPSKVKLQIKPNIQFDRETGSIFSGNYEPERSPSLLQSPRGVDMVKTPAQFSYSYPQIAIDIERKAFCSSILEEECPAWLEPSMVSTPEVFTSERAIQNLGAPGDLKTGEQEYDQTKELLLGLRQQHQEQVTQNLQFFDHMSSKAEERTSLSKEVFFMKDRLEQAMEAAPPSPLFQPHTPPPRTPPTTPPPLASPSSPIRRRQYRRYLEEDINRENINIRRARLTDQRLNADLEQIMNEIADLRIMKDQLLRAFGVKDIAHIPDIIPQKHCAPRF